MATDNLELSDNYSESEMSEISEGVTIISSCMASKKSKKKNVQVSHKKPANTCVSDSRSGDSETEKAEARKTGRKTKNKPKRGYKCPNTRAVKEEFLGILEVEHPSSLGQKTLILNYLKKLGIPLNWMIGIGFDNASIKTGVRAGLGALLTTSSSGGGGDDALPELFVLWFTSHFLALVVSHASKRLPEGLEPILRDLINYVANSPKRIV
ncbi:hypothetical protein QYM36_016166 [Artemia franciscana]|uniref:Uncharacterized protein n=1 Tax=Artemia franciscana TaxID=6661 RepID=A0AA88HIQ3_ARTSF|nr:hypothetical protein QYM36_016166 [Artemia franciscana]